ncbi:MAG TPA: SdrD B-like domain-containing protein, partial [Longimicrobium sp.]|nr:SdrD B-like domain-containing protein [Longimicrobium sp.]
MTRIPFRSVGFVLAAALFAAGCTESTGPDGTPTDLTVRAYVDADGSGTFNAGDAPLAGMTVTATGLDGTAVQATTDAQGAAVFAGLEPGSYTLSMAGAAPAGAVLATASTPVVIATSAGGAATAEFRFAYFPGTLSGVLFRDDNGNGVFDAATDLPAPGITVQLFAGATASGTPVATTTTSAAGAYSFPTLRPGTYTLRFVAPPGITIVGGADQQVTVGANTPVTSNVRFTGNLTIPIVQAKTRALGSSVTVEGIVTTTLGEFTSTGTPPAGNLYVQDATAGIQVFGIPVSEGLVPGDSIRVTGTLGTFSGEVQITTPGLTVTKLGTGTPKTPRVVSGTELASRGLEGSLVRLNGLTVLGVGAQSTPTSSFNVTVQAPDGTVFTVRVEGRTNVERPVFLVGQTYNISGIAAAFTAGGVTSEQLKPRSTADVVRVSPSTIAEVKAAAVGSEVSTRGVVTTTLGEFTSTGTPPVGNLYIQDATGGIQVFGVPVSQGLVPGDSVTVTGTLGTFSGELQITTPNLAVTKVGTGTVPAPQVITGAQLASRAFEGSLVRVNDLVVNSVGNQSSTTSSYNVGVTAPDGTTFTVRVEGRTNLERTAITVGATYDFVGIATAFSSGTPAVVVEQLKPRS